MFSATDVGFTEMRIAKVVGLGLPLADRHCYRVVLDEVSGDRHLVIGIGETEAFWLATRLQGLEFGRPMTYDLAAALVQAAGGRIRRVRVDRLVEGAYAATVEVEGPLGTRSVDARASDALNLAAIAGTPVFVSPDVLGDCHGRQEGDSAEARLLRTALTTPQMTIRRETA